MSQADVPAGRADGPPVVGEGASSGGPGEGGPEFGVPGVATEPAPGGWLPGILRFFVVPLLLVGASVAIFAGLGAVVGRAPPTARELVASIAGGGKNARWQAAQELSNLVYRKDVDLAKDERLVAALADAFQRARADGDDPRILQLLATLLGRSPAPQAGPTLVAALADGNPDVRIYVAAALAEQGDPASLPSLLPRLQDLDPGVRTMAAYAVAAVAEKGGPAVPAGCREALASALQDPSTDVKWNAALGLARLGHPEGADVVWQLLHREYVRACLHRGDAAVAGGVLAAKGSDPATPAEAEERILMNALSAAWRLKDVSMIEGVAALAAGDPSTAVRNWALQLQAELAKASKERGAVPPRAWASAK